MDIVDKAKYYLSPSDMMSKWEKEGTLIRKMKVFDKENTYMPKNLFQTLLRNNTLKLSNNMLIKRQLLFIYIFHYEDENGVCKIEDLKNAFKATNKTLFKHIDLAIKEGLLSIIDKTDTTITFDYNSLLKKMY